VDPKYSLKIEASNSLICLLNYSGLTSSLVFFLKKETLLAYAAMGVLANLSGSIYEGF
jgi:hypothetical protein